MSGREKSTASPKNTDAGMKSSQTSSQIKAISAKRVLREMEQLKASPLPCFVKMDSDPKDIKKWVLTFEPRFNPYKHGSFRVKLDIHAEYPFKPPRLQFLTPIYHPNVDDKGVVCLSITQMDNWKSATTLVEILTSLLNLVENPEPERALRLDLAEQYIHNKVGFYKMAAVKAKKDTDKDKDKDKEKAAAH